MTEFADNERRLSVDRRSGDRRIAETTIEGAERRSGEDRRLVQRRRDYDEAVDAAKFALIRCGLDSREFARAADASELARRRLVDLLREASNSS